MSKANSPVKVLRVALSRVQKRWGKGSWSNRDNKTGQYNVCLQGAITGGCVQPLTQAQKDAMAVVETVVQERYKTSIILLNDAPDTTKEQIEEVIKLAIIKLETGYLDEAEIQEVVDNFS